MRLNLIPPAGPIIRQRAYARNHTSISPLPPVGQAVSILPSISPPGPPAAGSQPAPPRFAVIEHQLRNLRSDHFDSPGIAGANPSSSPSPRVLSQFSNGAVPRSAIGSKPITAAPTASTQTAFVPATKTRTSCRSWAWSHRLSAQDKQPVWNQ